MIVMVMVAMTIRRNATPADAPMTMLSGTPDVGGDLVERSTPAAHSLSLSVAMVTGHLLSTLCRTTWIEMVPSTLIHSEMNLRRLELEDLSVPWRRARNVTAWGELGKQRKLAEVM